MSVFRDLFWYFKQEKKSYGFGIFILVLVAGLEIFPPYVVRLVVDGIEQGTLTRAELFKWLGLLLASGIIIYFLRYAWRILIFGAAYRLGRLLRNRLYEHFTDHPTASDGCVRESAAFGFGIFR